MSNSTVFKTISATRLSKKIVLEKGERKILLIWVFSVHLSRKINLKLIKCMLALEKILLYISFESEPFLDAANIGFGQRDFISGFERWLNSLPVLSDSWIHFRFMRMSPKFNFRASDRLDFWIQVRLLCQKSDFTIISIKARNHVNFRKRKCDLR